MMFIMFVKAKEEEVRGIAEDGSAANGHQGYRRKRLGALSAPGVSAYGLVAEPQG